MANNGGGGGILGPLLIFGGIFLAPFGIGIIFIIIGIIMMKK